MKTERAFWDTSAIIPLCVLQETTVSARKANRIFTVKVVWWGTAVEVRSSLARLKRTGELEAPGFDVALHKWLQMNKRGHEIKPSQRLLDIAAELPDQFALKALDAFQLAAALAWCGERPRKRPFVCADKRLGDAAERAGFDVVSLV